MKLFLTSLLSLTLVQGEDDIEYNMTPGGLPSPPVRRLVKCNKYDAILPDGQWEMILNAMVWTEGPAWWEGKLVFSDTRLGKIFSWDPEYRDGKGKGNCSPTFSFGIFPILLHRDQISRRGARAARKRPVGNGSVDRSWDKRTQVQSDHGRVSHLPTRKPSDCGYGPQRSDSSHCVKRSTRKTIQLAKRPGCP